MVAMVSPPPVTPKDQALVLWFDHVGITDIPYVGGKNASLGEMVGQLRPQGVNVPTGFAVTAHAYRMFIEAAGLQPQLQAILADLDVESLTNLRQRGRKARSLILEAPFPETLVTAIRAAYLQLCEASSVDPAFKDQLDVAVRSSATAEDLPEASFAGQQETYLNVQGVAGVLNACHRCFASLFTDRALSYRAHHGFDHFEVALSVGVQRMVRSDLGTAGVMFTLDTESGFADVVLITAAYGLGENVVQGTVTPDEYWVHKPTLKQGFRPILDQRLGSKALKLIYDLEGSKLTRNVPVPRHEQQKFALTHDDVLTLARWACMIEDHYSEVRGTPTPMDIEWARDGLTGELFIVQARPETVQSRQSEQILRTYRLLPETEYTGDEWGSSTSSRNGETSLLSSSPPQVLATGRAVGERIGQGPARVIHDVQQMELFQPGDVLVTARTDPDWEPIMKQAAAIVTDQGGRTCHAAIIARELGIPAIVGCGDACDRISPLQPVTVSCAEGDEGRVYAGQLSFEMVETPLTDLPSTHTQILMNIGNPEQAFKLASLPCDGVGLARLEFIIANHIQVHPLALIHFEQLTDPLVQQKIADLTAQYPYKPDYFVDRLAHGIARIAAAFFPRPVIVRLSDLKSNEYANLLGGKQFEPIEENPMLGWRGASRYYDEQYRVAFGLECKALKRVREQMGLSNIIPMIPFCRTPDEGRKVLAVMATHGLQRGEQGLQVYVMCEVPSNVILAEQFCEIFDGFSIGSNDLTQLTLGLDRDSSLVAPLFDERNPGVMEMVRQVIAKAKAKGRKVGICGQAPSDYPEFTAFLVAQGIDSISLNPDAVLKTLIQVAQAESSNP